MYSVYFALLHKMMQRDYAHKANLPSLDLQLDTEITRKRSLKYSFPATMRSQGQ